MGTVNVTLGDGKKLNLILGQQLENAVTAVVFDFSAWKTEFGSGTLGLSIQRHGDTQPYAVVPTVSGTNATWNISELDTAYKGVGEVQVTYTVGSVVKKSTVYKFTVYRSLGENGEYPSPGQTWQEEIEDELADVKQDLSDAVKNTSTYNESNISRQSSGFFTVYFQMSVGKQYKFTNTSLSDCAFNIRSRVTRDGANAENIRLPLAYEETYYFTPTVNTYYLYVYSSGAGSFNVKEVDSIFENVERKTDINEYSKQDTEYKIECSQGFQTVYYPLIKGHYYVLWNDGGTSFNIYSRLTETGANVQEVARPLYGKHSFIASENTNYLYIYASAKSLFYIADIDNGNRITNVGAKKINFNITSNSRAYDNNGTLSFTSSDAYFSYAKIQVSVGEKYDLFGRSGSASFCIFTDDNLQVIESINGSNGKDDDGLRVTVPTGATQMYVNFSYATLRKAIYRVEKYTTSNGLAENNGHVVIEVDINGTKDFTSLSDAVKSITDSCRYKVYDIIIYEGTYNVVAELGGQEYMNSIQSYVGYAGIILPDYVNLIGVGDVTITGIIPMTYTWNKYACTSFSPINMNTGNHVLKNITVIAQNCRYAIHDDSSNKYTNWNKQLINCRIVHNGNSEVSSNEDAWTGTVAYGMGHSEGSTLQATNCYFKANGLPGFSCHDLGTFSTGANLIFVGCEFVNTNQSAVNGDLKLGTVDQSDVSSTCILIGNKLSKLYLYDERTQGAGENNRWLVIGGGNSSQPIADTTETPITVTF